MSRDDYFRCKVCGKLFPDDQCIKDPIKGYQCPQGCVEPFHQPPYESPFQDE